MPRNLTSSFVTAIESDVAEFVHLIELDFSGGFLRINTGAEDLSWNGFTWTAVGGNLSFPGVQETNDIKSQGIKMEISGVDLSLVATLLTNSFRGRTVKIWRAHLNSSTGAIIADPPLLFSGLQLASYEVEEEIRRDGPNTVRITTTLSGLLGIERVVGIQTGLTAHQHHYPGDLFFQHTAQLAHRVVSWGSIPIRTGPGGGWSTIEDPNFGGNWSEGGGL